MSAVGSLAAAGQQSAAADFESQQYKLQAEQTRLQATQAETQRREELTANLETIQAIRAGRGVGAYSPTGDAILTSTTEDAMRDMRIERLNLLEKADLSQRAGIMAQRKGQTSLLAGNLSAGGEILSTAGKLYGSSAYPSLGRR